MPIMHDVGEHARASRSASAIRRSASRADHELADDLGRRRGCAPARWVPVWQKLQVSVQPTWLEMQTEPRSSSGMLTVSASLPSGKRSSHLRVPSVERCSVTISGRSTTNSSARRSRVFLAMLVMRPKSVTPCQ